jgi:hypothetical protein
MISALSTQADMEGDADDPDVPDLVARSLLDLNDSDPDEEDNYQPPRIPPTPPPRVPSIYATASLTTHRHTTIAAFQSTTYTTRAEFLIHMLAHVHLARMSTLSKTRAKPSQLLASSVPLVQLKECLLSQSPSPMMTQLHIKPTFYSFNNPCTLRNLTNICCAQLKCGQIRSW